MPNLDPSAEAFAALADSLASLQKKVDVISQGVEVQNAVQLEIAKLLQSFHEQQQALPRQVLEIINGSLESYTKQKFTDLTSAIGQIDAQLKHMQFSFYATKQVANMTLRRLGPVGEKIRCVFIVQSIPMWDALAEVHAAMTKDERFEPMVVSINHSHLGRAAFTGEEEVHQGLDSLGIPHLRLNVPPLDALDILRTLEPDIIFRQQQWDSPVPLGLRTPEITFARICIVPYGMGLLANPEARNESEEAHPNNYDQSYHRMAWRVFCETEQTQAYYRSFEHSDPDKFILSGYPKHDKLLKAKGKGSWPLPEPDGRTFRVIWAPHHSIAARGLGFGVFHRIYEQMLAWARNTKDIQFIFKPHPALAHSAANGGVISAESYSGFLSEWASLPNCGICEGDYGDLFDASDLMLTDGVSFLTEYHLFGKPLIFFDSRNHARLNTIGQLAERCTHTVTEFKQMRKAVIEYKNGKAWGYEKERNALLRLLRPVEQPAPQIILDTIARDIQSTGY